MKDWFKPVFAVFITRLIRKLKFLINIVDFAPRNVMSNVKPMQEDEGCNLVRNVREIATGILTSRNYSRDCSVS